MANPNMPHGENRIDGNGYVVYTRQSLVNGSPTQWEFARRRQEEKINNWYSIISIQPTTDQYIAAGQYLINLGEREEIKEKKLIESVLGIKFKEPKDEIELIRQFNEVLVGRGQYEDALHRLDVAINNKDNKGKDGRGLAPSITAFFGDKLEECFKAKLEPFFERKSKTIARSKNIDATIANMEKEILQLFYQSLDEALTALFTYQTDKDDRWGTLQGYEEILKVINDNPYIKQAFQDSLRNRFNPDKIKNIIRKNRETIIKKKGKIDIKKDLGKDILKLKGRKGSLGGDVNEIFNAARDMAFNATIGAEGTKISGSFVSNKMLTDEMTIYEINGEIDKKEMYEILQNLSLSMDYTKGDDLIQAHRVMKAFWDDHFSKLDGGFVVFKNAKSYGLKNIENEAFGGGFKGGKSVSLNRLATIPAPEGAFNNIDINKFVKVVANTIPGAILENEYNNISKWLYIYVTESIANLLFDDWERIGDEAANTGPNAIHALLLEDVNIPISIFLKGAGQALIDAATDFYGSDYVRMDVRRSSALYHEDKEGKPTGYPKDSTDGHPRVGYAWRIQRENTLLNYSISFRFYRNFNDEIVRKIIAYKS